MSMVSQFRHIFYISSSVMLYGLNINVCVNRDQKQGTKYYPLILFALDNVNNDESLNLFKTSPTLDNFQGNLKISTPLR